MSASVRLQEKQRIAALAYVEHGTFCAAAAAVGVCERTIRRWAVDSDTFKDSVSAATHEAVADTTRRLTVAGARAVDVLTGIMNAADVPPGVRVRAATTVLTALVSITEFADFERRLTALEKQTHDT